MTDTATPFEDESFTPDESFVEETLDEVQAEGEELYENAQDVYDEAVGSEEVVGEDGSDADVDTDFDDDGDSLVENVGEKLSNVKDSVANALGLN